MNLISQTDWLLLIAISLLFVAIGALIDLLLKKDEIKKLHDSCYRLSVLIADMPLKERQIKIAEFGVFFISKLGSWPTNFSESIYQSTFHYEQAYNEVNNNNKKVNKYFRLFVVSYFLVFTPSAAFLTITLNQSKVKMRLDPYFDPYFFLTPIFSLIFY